MLFESFRKLLGSKRDKKARRKMFVPQVDVLEDRRLLAAVTRFVDDSYTPGQLNATHFNSIQVAVTAANPGDTVKVLPGIYNESVVVDKKLVITGAFAPYVPVTGPGTTDPSLDPKKASIVDGLGDGNTFTLNANDVVLQGFTLENAGDNSVGVFTDPATTGDKIISNVIRDNTFGVYLNSNTSTAINTSATKLTLVAGNTIFNNNEAGPSLELPFAGAGNGIYSDQGLRNATIAGNRIFGQQNASIILVGGPAAATSQSKLTIAGNVIGQFTAPGKPVAPIQTGAPIIIANTVDSKINGNTSYNSIGSGIFFAGGSSQDRVIGNYITGAAFTGINLRFDPVDLGGNYPVTTVNTQIDIVGNTVTFSGDSGIRLRDGTSNILVRGNVLLYNGTAKDSTTGDGISLENSANNNIHANVAKFNGRNGINVDALSSGNTIQNNTSVRNNTNALGAFDYNDDSVGTGTAATANTYKNNSGKTQSRPGLIKFFIS